MGDADRSLWIVETSTGEKFEGNIVVSAVGSLHLTRYPDIPGIKEFSGDSFHTSEWKRNFLPKGKRIAVIGTGASSVQVVPSLAEQEPASLMVFQRSAIWPIPRGDYEYSTMIRTSFNMVPLAAKFYRWYLFWTAEMVLKSLFSVGKANTNLREGMKMHIKNIVKDPDLAVKLTPDYEIGCKRPAFTDDYIPTFNKEFVHLNTTKIDCITQKGIKTVDMLEHEFDAIVYATGFDVVKSINAFRQVGMKGTLEDNFGETPEAYLGITHPNHPNFFMLFGPGTISTSVIYMNECQVEYIIDGITKMLRLGAKSLVLKSEVLKEYKEFLQEGNEKSMFGNGACTSYYKNASGSNWVVWTKTLSEYWWKTCTFVLNQYNISF